MKSCANSWGCLSSQAARKPLPLQRPLLPPKLQFLLPNTHPPCRPQLLALICPCVFQERVLAFDAPPLGLGLVPTPMRCSVKVGFSSPAHLATAQPLTLYAPGKGCSQSSSKVRHAILSPQGACTSCLRGQGGRRAVSSVSS